MKAAIGETDRRRDKQRAYNEEHGITPTTIKKRIQDLMSLAGFRTELQGDQEAAVETALISPERVEETVTQLRAEMKARAKALDFEAAAKLRDRITTLESFLLGMPVDGEAVGAALQGKEEGRARSAGRGASRGGGRSRGRGGRKRP
jgi:excinuclease ABC subunit B